MTSQRRCIGCIHDISYLCIGLGSVRPCNPGFFVSGRKWPPEEAFHLPGSRAPALHNNLDHALTDHLHHINNLHTPHSTTIWTTLSSSHLHYIQISALVAFLHTFPPVSPSVQEQLIDKTWLWNRPYILKATQSAESAFSVSKILRKKCVNRDNKISRQKCVNHQNHKNLVSMWHFCWENSVC